MNLEGVVSDQWTRHLESYTTTDSADISLLFYYGTQSAMRGSVHAFFTALGGDLILSRVSDLCVVGLPRRSGLLRYYDRGLDVYKGTCRTTADSFYSV